MEETHIREIPLENDLRVHLYDGSRRLAGDRWLVQLIARIPMPVDAVWTPQPDDPVSGTDLKEALGEAPVFETVKSRHFIDEQEKDEIFQAMQAELVRHSLPYLGHPDFARRFLLKQYAEKLKRSGRHA